MARKKDYEVKGDKMVRKDDGTVIGEKVNGKWQGPHPWNDETIMGCDTPDDLRSSQMAMADED